MAQFYSWYNLIQASSTVSAQQPARRNGTCQHGKSRCRGDARQVSFWIGDAREAREGSRRCTSTEAVRVDTPAWVLTSCTTFLCGHAVPSLSRTAASLLLPCVVCRVGTHLKLWTPSVLPIQYAAKPLNDSQTAKVAERCCAPLWFLLKLSSWCCQAWPEINPLC